MNQKLSLTPVERSANSEVWHRFACCSTTDVDATVFITLNLVMSSYSLISVFRGMNINLTIVLGRSCEALKINNSECLTDKIIIKGPERERGHNEIPLVTIILQSECRKLTPG